MMKYVLKDKVYIDASNNENFNYSDGDDVENYILNAIANAVDVSTGSQELQSCIKDWPSLYHLHAKRANLLRPLASFLKGKTILEIGCGCGAITRYLGELDCPVTALEGSYRRASITAERCRDLSCVRVVCDNFLHFSTPEQFDVITLIGVLEYAQLFFPGQDPVADMLERVRTFLKPGGILLIAIENKLGLKYWTGAPEDHTGQAYLGIENRYTSTTAITFGKLELEALLTRSGFPSHNFLYPFPDYKLPHTLITDQGMQNADFDAHMLLLENFEYIQSAYYSSHFSTSLTGREVETNGLLPDLSNSFLVLAGHTGGMTILSEDLLAFNYNTQRKKEYWKGNIFRLMPGGDVQVHKYRLHEELPHPSLPIRNILVNEPYFKGRLLLFEAIKIVSKKEWTLEELYEWAKEYYQTLLTFSAGQGEQAMLDGNYIDLTPFNIILTGSGETKIFDQEWLSPTPIPLSYVFFRGLNYSLGSISFFNIPAEGTPVDILELSVELYKRFFPFSPDVLEQYSAMELGYFSGVGPGKYIPFAGAPLKIRKEVQLERNYLELEREMERHQHAFRKLQEELAQSNHRAFLLEAELEALKKTQGGSYPAGIEKFTEEIARLTKAVSGKAAANDPGTYPEKSKQLREETSSLQGLKQQVAQLEEALLWYKRTYQERSLLGLLKEKIAVKFRK